VVEMVLENQNWGIFCAATEYIKSPSGLVLLCNVFCKIEKSHEFISNIYSIFFSKNIGYSCGNTEWMIFSSTPE
jgi:hypothetical protein